MSNLKQEIFYTLLNISLLPLVAILWLTKKTVHITFFRVSSSRIGHLAGNNDLLLRKQKQGIIDPNLKYVGIAANDICNKTLLNIIKRHLTIIQIPQPKFVRAFTKILAECSILSTYELFTVIPFKWNEYGLFNNTPPGLSFNQQEQAQGQQLLNTLNIKGPYICFHARDPVHISNFLRKGDAKFNFRNCDINNYLNAAKYFTSTGSYALRMGAQVEKIIPSSRKNERIIDYAKKHRSDFGDIYLPATCKFFLGNTAGLYMIPTIFNIPVAHANLIPLKYPPYGKNDLFIPKKLWSNKESRYLTFKEIIYSDIINYFSTEEYEKASLKVEENTSQEILDLAIEMNERLNGTWKTTKEDEALQQKYKALFPLPSHCYGFPSRIGAVFLRENKELLD